MQSTNIHQGFWAIAWHKLIQMKLAWFCMSVLSLYFLVVLLASLGWIGNHWNDEVGVSYAPPAYVPSQLREAGENRTGQAGTEPSVQTPEQAALDPIAKEFAEAQKIAEQHKTEVVELKEVLPAGGDKWGRDLLDKTIKAAQVSISVGVSAAFIAVLIGLCLGATAGFKGGKIDALIEWFYGVFTSMPSFLLILAFSAVLGKGMLTVILILGLTGWTGTYRLVRSEYIKQRSLEYVEAAKAIGVPAWRQMFVHIMPNVSHLLLVQLSMLVVEFIKAEVVLSFLGLGVSIDSVSWGIMIGEVRSELVLGKWWQLAAAAGSMSLFVVSFSLFTDLLRDVLDPKGERA